MAKVCCVKSGLFSDSVVGEYDVPTAVAAGGMVRIKAYLHNKGIKLSGLKLILLESPKRPELSKRSESIAAEEFDPEKKAIQAKVDSLIKVILPESSPLSEQQNLRGLLVTTNKDALHFLKFFQNINRLSFNAAFWQLYLFCHGIADAQCITLGKELGIDSSETGAQELLQTYMQEARAVVAKKFPAPEEIKSTPAPASDPAVDLTAQLIHLYKSNPQHIIYILNALSLGSNSSYFQAMQRMLTTMAEMRRAGPVIALFYDAFDQLWLTGFYGKAATLAWKLYLVRNTYGEKTDQTLKALLENHQHPITKSLMQTKTAGQAKAEDLTYLDYIKEALNTLLTPTTSGLVPKQEAKSADRDVGRKTVRAADKKIEPSLCRRIFESLPVNTEELVRELGTIFEPTLVQSLLTSIVRGDIRIVHSMLAERGYFIADQDIPEFADGRAIKVVNDLYHMCHQLSATELKVEAIKLIASQDQKDLVPLAQQCVREILTTEIEGLRLESHLLEFKETLEIILGAKEAKEFFDQIVAPERDRLNVMMKLVEISESHLVRDQHLRQKIWAIVRVACEGSDGSNPKDFFWQESRGRFASVTAPIYAKKVRVMITELLQRAIATRKEMETKISTAHPVNKTLPTATNVLFPTAIAFYQQVDAKFADELISTILSVAASQNEINTKGAIFEKLSQTKYYLSPWVIDYAKKMVSCLYTNKEKNLALLKEIVEGLKLLSLEVKVSEFDMVDPPFRALQEAANKLIQNGRFVEAQTIIWQLQQYYKRNYQNVALCSTSLWNALDNPFHPLHQALLCTHEVNSTMTYLDHVKSKVRRSTPLETKRSEQVLNHSLFKACLCLSPGSSLGVFYNALAKTPHLFLSLLMAIVRLNGLQEGVVAEIASLGYFTEDELIAESPNGKIWRATIDFAGKYRMVMKDSAKLALVTALQEALVASPSHASILLCSALADIKAVNLALASFGYKEPSETPKTTAKNDTIWRSAQALAAVFDAKSIQEDEKASIVPISGGGFAPLSQSVLPGTATAITALTSVHRASSSASSTTAMPPVGAAPAASNLHLAV